MLRNGDPARPTGKLAASRGIRERGTSLTWDEGTVEGRIGASKLGAASGKVLAVNSAIDGNLILDSEVILTEHYLRCQEAINEKMMRYNRRFNPLFIMKKK